MKLALEDVQEYRLTVVKGAQPGSRISFDAQPRTIRIGRALENDVVINDSTVSRAHAVVEIRPDGAFLSDNASASGIEKMGFRVGAQPDRLESGDEFRLGDTMLKFEIIAKKGAVKAAAAREAAAQVAAAKGEALPADGATEQSLLSRLGLETMRARVFALVGLIILLGLLFTPGKSGLAPQRSGQILSPSYTSLVGYLGSATDRLDGAVYDIPTDVPGLGVYVDLVGTAGLDLRAGGEVFGTVAAGREWNSYQVLALPAAIATNGTGRLVIDNLGYSPEEGDIDPKAAKQWGAKKMWVVRIRDLASSPGQLSSEIRALSELHTRVADKLGNRYALVEGLRKTILGAMRLSGRRAVLVDIPRAENIPDTMMVTLLESARFEIENGNPGKALDRLIPALSEANGALNRDYRQQDNFLKLALKKASKNEEISAYAMILQLIPDSSDPRHRAIVSEVQKLSRDSRKRFEETKDRLSPLDAQ